MFTKYISKCGAATSATAAGYQRRERQSLCPIIFPKKVN